MGVRLTYGTFVASAFSSGLWITALLVPRWAQKVFLVGVLPLEMRTGIASVWVEPSVCQSIQTGIAQRQRKAFCDAMPEGLFGETDVFKFRERICGALANMKYATVGAGCWGLEMVVRFAMMLLICAVTSLLLQIGGNVMLGHFWYSGCRRGRFKRSYINVASGFFVCSAAMSFVALAGYSIALIVMNSLFEGVFNEIPFVGTAWYPPYSTSWFLGISATCVQLATIGLVMANKGSSKFAQQWGENPGDDSEDENIFEEHKRLLGDQGDPESPTHALEYLPIHGPPGMKAPDARGGGRGGGRKQGYAYGAVG